VSLTASAAQAMRRAPIQGCGDAFSISSLKHFDEQTLAVLAALKLALGDAPAVAAGAFREWGVLAAPRYLGRSLMAPMVARFHEEGAWGVSPHLVPHRSLHSISGTVSQFLKAHGPNFGVGGGPGGEAEALLAAAVMLDSLRLPGVWLVLSRIEPERSGEAGRPHPDSRCEAVALALAPAGQAARAQLEATTEEPEEGLPPMDFAALAGLGDALARRAAVTHALGRMGRLRVQPASGHLVGPPYSFYPSRSLAAG
jgi:hypothetical protein